MLPLVDRTITFLAALVLGVGVIALLIVTDWFGNSPIAYPLLPVGPIACTFSLYGLLSKLVLRKGQLHDGVDSAARGGMRMLSIPLAIKILFFLLLLPLLLPQVARAKTHAGVAGRAVGFWMLVAVACVLVGLGLRLAFHH